MKVLYSELKQFLPKLKASAKQVGEVLTMSGFLMDKLEPVVYQGKKDFIIGLEVRQNRADCLSALGIARELSAYYKIPLLDKPTKLPKFSKKYEINIRSKKEVKRVMAARIKDVKNGKSPVWLKQYVELHGMNSINLLVDLSNYILFSYGYPSHIFDASLVSQTTPLTWAMNSKYKEFSTLDGTVLNLKKDSSEIIIEDGERVLAIAGIIGGKHAAVSGSTTEIIVEAAVYDHDVIRKNSRSLKVITEASNRLDKHLDPTNLEQAFNHLIELIKLNSGGNIFGQADYFPNKKISKQVVTYNPTLASKLAGIPISDRESLEILQRLGFTVSAKKTSWKILVPAYRTDVDMAEDIAEEIIRTIGYDKIPSDTSPILENTSVITPKHVLLANNFKHILSANGLDEILSLPLIAAGENEQSNFQQQGSQIYTQNSINEEFPALRQTLFPGLKNQLHEQLKKNLEFLEIFEIGKVFSKLKGGIEEHDALGILIHNPAQNRTLNYLQNLVEKLLLGNGLTEIVFEPAEQIPGVANPYSCWNILAQGENIGILFKLKDHKLSGTFTVKNSYFAELNILHLSQLISERKIKFTVSELIDKLVVLDANIETSRDQSPKKLIERLKKQVPAKHLWDIRIHDSYNLSDKSVRYTIRTAYLGLTDQAAKSLHEKLFPQD